MKSPTPLGASRAAIETLAETVASTLALRPGACLAPVVTRLGGRIIYATATPASPSPRLLARRRDDFDIFVPSLTTEAFNRMAIATALGFLFLHHPAHARGAPNTPMSAPRWPGDDRQAAAADIEATQFAYAFLMPARAFRDIWDAGHRDLARHFGVSTRAAALRARGLGLADLTPIAA
jgi:hypothetical protein